MSTETARYFGIIPAAGAGSRFGGAVAKQYVEVLGRPLLYYAAQLLLSYADLNQVTVAVAGIDVYEHAIGSADMPSACHVVLGGETRAHSVLNALHALSSRARPEDWVVVHDAVRPCVTHEELVRLIDAVAEHAVGGVLAIPVVDTIKRVITSKHCYESLSRQDIYVIQTPQCFRYGVLCSALDAAINEGVMVTDESSAIERMGQLPMLVPGSAHNRKVTYMEDLAWATWWLQECVQVDVCE